MWLRNRNWATRLSFKKAACALLVAGMGFLAPSGAYAHAVLLNASPANDAVVEAAPANVQLRFNEPVSVVRASIRIGEGNSLDLAATSGSEVDLAIPRSISSGTAIVSYRVVSEDGHPVGGSIVFHVGAPSAISAPAVADTSVLLQGAIWSIHIVSILYLAVLIGGTLFNRWLYPAKSLNRRPDLVIVLGVLFFSSGVYLQGLDEMGLGLVFAGLEPLLVASRSGAAIAAGMALVAVLLVSIPVCQASPAYLPLAVLAIGAASASFAFTGHCNVVATPWLARACIVLHGATLLFWIGSLPPLWRLSRTGPTDPLAGFSRVIPLPFFVLLIAGAALAWLELPGVQTIPLSLYGRLLVLKVGLVGILCALAIYNRFWLTRPAAAGDQTARRKLRRSIAAEVALAVAIVATASLWRFAGPDQLQYAARPQAFSIHLHSGEVMAQLKLVPDLAAGTAKAEVDFLTADFDPIDPQGATLRAWNLGAGVEPIKYDLRKSSKGGWEASGLPTFDPTGWKVDIEVLIDDFTMKHLEGELRP